jgi:hypothetical protein
VYLDYNEVWRKQARGRRGARVLDAFASMYSRISCCARSSGMQDSDVPKGDYRVKECDFVTL